MAKNTQKQDALSMFGGVPKVNLPKKEEINEEKPIKKNVSEQIEEQKSVPEEPITNKSDKKLDNPVTEEKKQKKKADSKIHDKPILSYEQGEMINGLLIPPKREIMPGLTRQTFYFTTEELIALDMLSYNKRIQKSEMVRMLIDAGIEHESPGLLEKLRIRNENLQ